MRIGLSLKSYKTPTHAAAALGLRSTMITESPRRKSLLIKRSRLTGCLAFTPLPVLGTCCRARVRVCVCVCVCVHHLQAYLCPHLFDVFKDHVAMAIKGLDAPQQLAVVAAADQYLSRGVTQLSSFVPHCVPASWFSRSLSIRTKVLCERAPPPSFPSPL